MAAMPTIRLPTPWPPQQPPYCAWIGSVPIHLDEDACKQEVTAATGIPVERAIIRRGTGTTGSYYAVLYLYGAADAARIKTMKMTWSNGVVGQIRTCGDHFESSSV